MLWFRAFDPQSFYDAELTTHLIMMGLLFSISSFLTNAAKNKHCRIDAPTKQGHKAIGRPLEKRISNKLIVGIAKTHQGDSSSSHCSGLINLFLPHDGVYDTILASSMNHLSRYISLKCQVDFHVQSDLDIEGKSSLNPLQPTQEILKLSF